MAIINSYRTLTKFAYVLLLESQNSYLRFLNIHLHEAIKHQIY
jgi:hypothetical protein